MTDRKTHEALAPATVDAPCIAIVAFATVTFLAASMGVLALVFFSFTRDDGTPPPRTFPEPQLQVHPSADLQRYLANQRAQLSGYRWADADRTVVAIPIERAMQIIAQRGADGYRPVASMPSAASATGAKP